MKSRSEVARPLALNDAAQALTLYNQLTVGPAQTDPAALGPVLAHPGTQVFGAFADGELVAIATLHLLPNVVWAARPYGVIENVATRRDLQRRGHGRRVMEAAIAAAWAADAHKITLMTGTGRGASGFYEALGFTAKDKIAMVMRRA